LVGSVSSFQLERRPARHQELMPLRQYLTPTTIDFRYRSISKLGIKPALAATDK